MKKGLILFSAILLINFVSAQGISEILDSIDQSTLILYATFIISFCLLFFSLSKTLFKDPQHKVFAAIISATISLLLVYWVNQTGFDINGFFFELGVPEDILLTAVPFAILGGIIFVIIKFKEKSLYILGGSLFVLGIIILQDILAIVSLGAVIIIAVVIIHAILKFLKISSGKGRLGGKFKDYGAGI